MLEAYDGALATLGDIAGLRGQCLTRLVMPYCFTMLVAHDGVLAALGDVAGLRGQCLTRLLMPYCFTPH